MANQTDNFLVCVTSYNGDEADGLVVYRMDMSTGGLAHLNSTSAGAQNPMVVVSDPTKRFLFVADHVGACDGTPGGAVCAYGIDPGSGALSFLNRQPSGGEVPCHLNMSRDGRFVLVANYMDGRLSVLPIQADGHLGRATDTAQHAGSSVNPNRQTEAHPHSFVFDPANRFAFSADLGMDQIVVYRFDPESGTIALHDPLHVPTRPGAGPRHIRIHPNRRLVYVITELDNTVMALTYDAATGVLEPFQTVPALPEGFTGTSYGADIRVHPSGKFVYGSNRGHESIVIFSIDEMTGELSCVGHEPTRGEFPRGFTIDPTGTFLLVANENTHNIVSFRIDPDTGRLDFTGQETKLPKPTCFAFIATTP